MFDLEKYSENGRFLFSPKQILREVCNAPINKSGVYIIYDLRDGKEELIYIGRSGKMNADTSIFVRKAGLGGMKDRIVNGNQFGKVPRRISWPNQMIINKIDTLDVYWYVTHDNINNDCPRIVENKLLIKFVEMYNRLPIWNREL